MDLKDFLSAASEHPCAMQRIAYVLRANAAFSPNSKASYVFSEEDAMSCTGGFYDEAPPVPQALCEAKGRTSRLGTWGEYS